MASLDKGIARRIQRAVERFAETETGNIMRLQGIDPLEYRLRVGEWRVRFGLNGGKILVLRVLNRRDPTAERFQRESGVGRTVPGIRR